MSDSTRNSNRRRQSCFAFVLFPTLNSFQTSYVTVKSACFYCTLGLCVSIPSSSTGVLSSESGLCEIWPYAERCPGPPGWALCPLPTHLSLQPGLHLHFVEQGSGPAVCLCHGFPESWFSWRYQVRETAREACHHQGDGRPKPGWCGPAWTVMKRLKAHSGALSPWCDCDTPEMSDLRAMLVQMPPLLIRRGQTSSRCFKSPAGNLCNKKRSL